MSKKTISLLLIVIFVVITVAGAVIAAAKVHRNPSLISASGPGLETDPQRFDVVIRSPKGPLLIESGELDEQGRPLLVTCNSCHATREPRADIDNPLLMEEFHLGLEYAHGGLTCYACHDPADPARFRLADARTLPSHEVMTLCSQCHGPQARDYRNGSHGGMQGYWDLTRGPRERNNCIDCHDPHAPAYPVMMPAPGPRDGNYGIQKAESAKHPSKGAH